MEQKPIKSALITDLDNTLFDWFDIWRSTFIPMLKKTVEISGIPEEQLIREIHAVHQEHGTAEYAFVLQELPSLLAKYSTPENIMEVLDPAIHASRSSRLEYLRLYAGVYDTLSELRAKRVRVIAYTESKQWYTQYRLKRLGLDHFIDHVYSPEDHDIVAIRKHEKVRFDFDHTQFSYTPKGEKKPNPSLLIRILEEQGLNVEDCVYVGDSEIKDVAMAKQAGVTSIFAKYGTGHFSDERKESYELLRKVTHWTEKEVQEEKELIEAQIPHDADFSINNFSELLEIIEFKKHEKGKPLKSKSENDESTERLSSHEKASLLMDYWKQTSDVQQHFNDVSIKLRNFAVVVFSGFLTGVGLSIHKDISISLFGESISAGVLFAIAGVVATQLIHFMDTYWYHVFLKGAVSTSSEIEKEIKDVLGVKELSDGISASSQNVCVTSLFGMIHFPIGWSELYSKFLIFKSVKVDSTLRHKIFYRWLIAVFFVIGSGCLFVDTAVKVNSSTNEQPSFNFVTITPELDKVNDISEQNSENVGFIISGTNVRVRSAASFESEIIGLLPVGKRVIVTDINNEQTWVKIILPEESNSASGWVHRDYIARLK